MSRTWLHSRTAVYTRGFHEGASIAAVFAVVALVLLLAVKDRAAEVRFEPKGEEYCLRYLVEGNYYEMVPPPRHLAG